MAGEVTSANVMTRFNALNADLNAKVKNGQMNVKDAQKQVADFMAKHDIRNKVNPKIYMYCGGSELDEELYGFVEPFKNNLINNGYKSDLIETCIDMKQVHNEGAWRIYFKPAYAWLLNIK